MKESGPVTVSVLPNVVRSTRIRIDYTVSHGAAEALLRNFNNIKVHLTQPR